MILGGLDPHLASKNNDEQRKKFSIKDQPNIDKKFCSFLPLKIFTVFHDQGRNFFFSF
jgi:hypothetical protein